MSCSKDWSDWITILFPDTISYHKKLQRHVTIFLIFSLQSLDVRRFDDINESQSQSVDEQNPTSVTTKTLSDICPFDVNLDFITVACRIQDTAITQILIFFPLSRFYPCHVGFGTQLKGLNFPGSQNTQFCRLVVNRSRHLLKPVRTYMKVLNVVPESV